MFKGLIAFYGRTLRVVLRHQTITLMVALATLILTVVLYIVIPKGFFPVQDTGSFRASPRLRNPSRIRPWQKSRWRWRKSSLRTRLSKACLRLSAPTASIPL